MLNCTDVSGAAGFVGRHTVAQLMLRGWDVEGIDIHPGARIGKRFFSAGKGLWEKLVGGLKDAFGTGAGFVALTLIWNLVSVI